jgi:phospholipase C
MRLFASASVLALLVGCSSSSSNSAPGGGDSGATGPTDASSPHDAASGGDAAREMDGGAGDACAGVCPASAVEHLVIIVQENHTFDNHFGGYCTATPGSNPTCNTGPACCEAMPPMDPTGVAPTPLTDTEHGQWDPNHTQACEKQEIDDGKMDGFATAGVDAGGGCGSTHNVAIADPTIIQPYWTLAGRGALGDRYFQSAAGESDENDMYLAVAKFKFLDNTLSPQGATGDMCDFEGNPVQYTDKTIGDLLKAAQVPWKWFSDGYAAMVQANGSCPPTPSDCPAKTQVYPCAFDPSDVPFEYFGSLVNGSFLQDASVLTSILQGTGELPAVSFVKAIGYKSEHPGSGTTLSAGVRWVSTLVQNIEASTYASNTLVVLTYDEGGGYFDHVAPPAASTVDNQPYGMRLPFLAVGPMVRQNWISHVPMEHASLLKFIEWNWLGRKTGQLGARDAVANNIGSVLDPAKTGVTVPEN